ncbi:uncharacterized protein LOC112513040 [Cynara cardunculus var. scolymus]|uniref:Putative S-adenosyl-L-methionine-dependent methyltransferase n=1 Tax=Cynara cardunculus var. scolymus TaxID=59895 RepID=A0A103Y4Y1_CYNCS|nr:uncharacterized protein LOC112513040 [Cynara cardunculus var. scolymus]KVI02615.1 putative S-adenosyl-L-methionine-dependent methyltransferase [Cynara cardunculus var. scolymus]
MASFSPSPLLTLCFITLFSIFIFISTILNPNFISNLNSYNSHDFPPVLPSSLHHQISNLQTQFGILLEKIHSEEKESSKTLSRFSDQVLRVALLLDKLSESLSGLHGDTTIATSVTYQDSTQPEETEAENHEEEEEERFIELSEKVLHYTNPKPNRLPDGKKNFMDLEAINPSIGLGCTRMTANLDRYSTYKPYSNCPDDSEFAQKLILRGCDPLPRRRCFSRSPPNYNNPLPLSSSLWTQPNDSNILWNHYTCKNYNCLISIDTKNKQGFHKCADCFNLSKKGWEVPLTDSESAEISIDEVLALKRTEIRIGLDFSPTTGSFAALMRERNVTIASATLNLGAPFNEVIALRGLLPLYVSIGSRLPFFDNTLDLVHSTLFLDGWIGFELLEYVVFDWDRVLRPKGMLWLDRFFCKKEDMKGYISVIEKLKYRKVLWRVVTKKDRVENELFLSAVLEKPLRAM